MLDVQRQAFSMEQRAQVLRTRQLMDKAVLPPSLRGARTSVSAGVGSFAADRRSRLRPGATAPEAALGRFGVRPGSAGLAFFNAGFCTDAAA